MTTLPDSADFTGSTVTEGGQKTFITNLRNFLAGVLGTAGTAEAARTALGLGSAATSAASSFLASSNNLSDLASAATARSNLDVYSKAEVDAAASGDFQSQIDTLKTNMALTVIRLIANAGSSYMGMVDGWADEFEDSTGIGSLGTATYDTTGDYIHNPGVYSQVTLSAGIISQSGMSEVSLSNLVDANTTNNAFATDSAGIGSHVTIDFGLANDKALTKWVYYVNGAVTATWDIKYSDNGTSWTTAYAGLNCAGGAGAKTAEWSDAGSHRYWRSEKTNGASGGQYHSELQVFTSDASPNIIVTSITKTADAVPLQGRVTLVVDPQVTVTYGTDNRIRMSRDGGTTWVTGVMAVEASNLDFPGGYTVDVVTASFDFTGTPSGTSMVLEWSTFNNKHQLLHAWYPEWSV